MPSRVWVSLAALCGLLLGGFVAPGAAAGEATAVPKVVGNAATAGAGTAVVRIKTPTGLPVNVVLSRGQQQVTLAKLPHGKLATATAQMSPGTYRVRAARVVFQGRLFVGKAKPAKVKIRRGKSAKVTVTYRLTPTAGGLQATSITRSTVALTWTAPGKAKVALRRTVGSRPALSVKNGVGVRVSGSTATDAGLPAGTQYSYSLFTKVKGKWSPPVTVVAGTAAEAGSGTAAYVASSTTLILPPGSPDLGVPTGDGVQVSLAAATPTPVLGAGVVLPVSATLPGGFLGTVARISPGGRTVWLTAAGLGDAFDYYEIDVPDIAAPQTTLRLRAASVLHSRAAALGAGKVAASGLVSCSSSAGQEVTFSPTITPGGHFKGKINTYRLWNLKVPTSAKMDVALKVTLSGAIGVRTTGALTCGFGFQAVVLQIASAPVPISFTFTPTAQFTVAGAVDVSNLGYTVTAGVDVEGSFGGTSAFTGSTILAATPLTPTVTTNGTISVKVGGDVLVGPGAGTPNAGVIAAVGGQLNPLEAEFRPEFSFEDPRINACLNTQAAMTRELRLTARAWLGHWSASQTVTIDALSGSTPYSGSPWYLPRNCNTLPPTSMPTPGPTAPIPTPPTPPAAKTELTGLAAVQTATGATMTVSATNVRGLEIWGPPYTYSGSVSYTCRDLFGTAKGSWGSVFWDGLLTSGTTPTNGTWVIPIPISWEGAAGAVCRPTIVELFTPTGEKVLYTDESNQVGGFDLNAFLPGSEFTVQ